MEDDTLFKSVVVFEGGSPVYAVVKAGGHQYRVSKGDELTVDFIEGKEGDKVTFDQVLLIGGDKTEVGAPTIAGASVVATIARQERAPKILVFKYKRRKNYKKTMGHRQPVTVVQISEIKH